MIRHDMPQRSPEWFAIRCGKLTGSDVKDMLATIKSGEAAARRDLRARLVAERLTGRPQEDGYTSPAMQHGIDTEEAARNAYEAHSGLLVEAVGFLEHDELAAGCSPDGIVGDGLLELKCPKTATHLRYLRDPGALVKDYIGQLTHALWISGAPWIDIASFDNRLPPHLQFVMRRVPWSLAETHQHGREVEGFLDEVQLEHDALLGWSVLKETA